ncbi:MAG: hypothetical protein QNK40_12210 [Desulfobacterales bacterium]|nr:hypothetical protein [Desulfobacterales bacterium]
MPKTKKGNPFLIGLSDHDIMEMYGTSAQDKANLLIINEYAEHIKNRPFDLKLNKEYQSIRKNESTGWILKNQISGRFDLFKYGILFQMLLCGAIRYRKDQPAHIFQDSEHTIECVTAKNDVIFDIYFFWDGMCGTNSQQGWANFGISLSMVYGDKTASLSKMDGISYIGAKIAKGSLKLTDNFVKKKGTPVRFVIRYEMDLAANSDPLAVSEIHFEKPANNYFKIVTK